MRNNILRRITVQDVRYMKTGIALSTMSKAIYTTIIIERVNDQFQRLVKSLSSLR